MSREPLLSIEEQDVASREITKLERNGHTWRWMRWVYLVIALFMGGMGWWNFKSEIASTSGSVERVEAAMKELPPDAELLTLEQRAILESRRNATLVAANAEVSISSVLLAILYLMQSMIALYTALRVMMAWRRGPWWIIQAKMLRRQVNQCVAEDAMARLREGGVFQKEA